MPGQVQKKLFVGTETHTNKISGFRDLYGDSSVVGIVDFMLLHVNLHRLGVSAFFISYVSFYFILKYSTNIISYINQQPMRAQLIFGLYHCIRTSVVRAEKVVSVRYGS